MKDAAEKSKQTLLKRYNVSCNLQLPGIHRNKSKNSFKYPDIMLNRDKLLQWAIDFNSKNGTKPTYDDLSRFQECAYITAHKYVLIYKLKKYFKIGGFSRLETRLEDFIKTLNVEYIKHDRNQINPQELDFYFPEYNLAIEVNDNASHNSTKPYLNTTDFKSTQYHKEKTQLCKDKGIRLIHLWEWELTDGKEYHKIENFLLDIFKTKTKIYARKCKIKEISWSEAGKFYDLYHLQSRGKVAKINYGLYYNNELISCMSFGKPNFNSKSEWELLRYAVKFNYSIIGGAKKIFNKFIKEYKPHNIISYCDISKFTGDIYERLGFKLQRYTAPTFDWANHCSHYNWKVILDKGPDKILGTNYGKGTSNEEIMIKEGYVKVYNCGNAVYIHEKSVDIG